MNNIRLIHDFWSFVEQINFNLQSLISAWELLVNSSTELDSDLFRYDLVDITKEVLQYKFAFEYIQFMVAYNKKDLYRVGFVSFTFSLYGNNLTFSVHKLLYWLIC